MADGITTGSIKTDHLLGNYQNGRGNGRQVNFQSKSFRSFFECIPFTCSLEIDTALADAAGAGAAMEVAVAGVAITGAKLGDFVWITSTIDPADLSISAYVTVADVVTIQLENLTGGDLTTFNSNGGEKLNGLILRIRGDILDQLHNDD